VAAGAAALAAAPATAKVTAIHAHRGGPFVDGKARHAEASLPAFRAAARRGFVLELDTRVTLDGAVVVVHDDTLDRTTACTGRLAETPFDRLRSCPLDALGSPGSTLGSRAKTTSETIPRLADVLRIAKARGVRVNVELNDFDADSSRATKVLDALAASGLPRRRVIVQSFFSPNLALAARRLPGVALARLSLRQSNESALDEAIAARQRYISPEWPVSRAYVRRAHRAGLRVLPYTLNTPARVRAAARSGVDELITDDPVMARRALRRSG